MNGHKELKYFKRLGFVGLFSRQWSAKFGIVLMVYKEDYINIKACNYYSMERHRRLR